MNPHSRVPHFINDFPTTPLSCHSMNIRGFGAFFSPREVLRLFFPPFGAWISLTLSPPEFSKCNIPFPLVIDLFAFLLRQPNFFLLVLVLFLFYFFSFTSWRELLITPFANRVLEVRHSWALVAFFFSTFLEPTDVLNASLAFLHDGGRDSPPPPWTYGRLLVSLVFCLV